MTDITRIKRDGYAALLADHCELADNVADLVARVAALEVVPKAELYGMLEVIDEINRVLSRVTDLEAQQAAQKPTYHDPSPPPARTATPNQSYTWQPGDAWSQYTAATDGPGFVHSPGYPQDDAEDVVTVPVAGDVTWDTGAVSWRKQWTATGWKPVTP